MRRRLSALLVPVFVAFALLTAACGDDSGAAAGAAPTGSTGSTESADPVTLHLAYFANITHGSALVGIGNGTYAKTLGSNVELKTSIFNAGTDEIEALFAGAIDAGYIGPNPAVNVSRYGILRIM